MQMCVFVEGVLSEKEQWMVNYIISISRDIPFKEKVNRDKTRAMNK